MGLPHRLHLVPPQRLCIAIVSILCPVSSFQKWGDLPITHDETAAQRGFMSPRAAQLGSARARFELRLVSAQAQAPSSAVGTLLSVAACRQCLQATARLGVTLQIGSSDVPDCVGWQTRNLWGS